LLSSASGAAGAAGHSLVHTVTSPASGTPSTLTSQQGSVTSAQSTVASGPLVSPTQTSGAAGPGSFFGTDSLSSSGDTQVVLTASLGGSQQQSPTAAPVSPHLQQNGFTSSGLIVHDFIFSNAYILCVNNGWQRKEGTRLVTGPGFVLCHFPKYTSIEVNSRVGPIINLEIMFV